MTPLFTNFGNFSDTGFGPLKDYIIDHTGMAYYVGKETDLARKIENRMNLLDLSDCGSYLAFLQRGDEGKVELDELIGDLTIGETFFFRHQEQFNALRDVILPDILKRNARSRHLRIWCAGCAIGAEPYSVAIMLQRDFPVALSGWDVSIIATDINRRFLASAGEGRFNDWALRSSPEAFRRCFFRQDGDQWVVNGNAREMIAFQYHNLVNHPFPSLASNLAAFDVIFCRNVMMYFEREVMRRLVHQFQASLVDGGWMLVGPSESDIEIFRNNFKTVSVPGATVYQKVGEAIAPNEPLWSPVPQVEKTGAAPLDWPPLEPEVSLPDAPDLESHPSGGTPGNSSLDEIRQLADRGEWKEALNQCDALLERDALDPMLHFIRALLLENSGQIDWSEKALRKAIYLDRGFALAHYHLGLLLRRGGDGTGAVRAYRNVTRIVSGMDGAELLPGGENVTAGELKEVAEGEIEILSPQITHED